MLILASTSPRRKRLLRQLTSSFLVVAPQTDETLLHIDPKDLPLEESRAKAYSVAGKYPNDEILACDTVVILEGRVFGKPADLEQAKEMLRQESGKKQVVLSGYTYLKKGLEITRSVVSYVYFKKLSEEQIAEYVEKKRPLDKAGAYGIQDDDGLVERIEGSFYNVMGLPLEDIAKHCPIQK